MTVFKFFGALLALYTLYSAISGTVHAKSGMGGRVVSRQDSPEYFWVVMAIYACLSMALLLYF